MLDFLKEAVSSVLQAAHDGSSERKEGYILVGSLTIEGSEKETITFPENLKQEHNVRYDRDRYDRDKVPLLAGASEVMIEGSASYFFWGKRLRRKRCLPILPKIKDEACTSMHACTHRQASPFAQKHGYG